MKRATPEGEGEKAAGVGSEEEDVSSSEDVGGGGGGEGAAGPGASKADDVNGKGYQKSKKRSQVVLSDGRVVSCKVRNHVNPLLPHFQKPVPVPLDGNWAKVFGDLAKPLVVDLGSAKGRFCLEGAKRFPNFNWLGIEIREPLVVRANEWVKEHALNNLHYIFGNASAGMSPLLASMPPGFVQRVTIQCPDPLFKKRHQKRRMVTDRLVRELADHMHAGAVIFVQSDVEQVAMQMVDTIASVSKFVRIACLPDDAAAAANSSSSSSNSQPAVAPIARPREVAGGDYHATDIAGGEWEHKGAGAEADGSYQWLSTNPLGLMSERESATLSRGLPMFRALFQRREEVAAEEKLPKQEEPASTGHMPAQSEKEQEVSEASAPPQGPNA